MAPPEVEKSKSLFIIPDRLLEKSVYAIAQFPQRCPVAPEARKVKRKLRHLLNGKKPHVYRAIYEVDERR